MSQYIERLIQHCSIYDEGIDFTFSTKKVIFRPSVLAGVGSQGVYRGPCSRLIMTYPQGQLGALSGPDRTNQLVPDRVRGCQAGAGCQ